MFYFLHRDYSNDFRTVCICLGGGGGGRCKMCTEKACLVKVFAFNLSSLHEIKN